MLESVIASERHRNVCAKKAVILRVQCRMMWTNLSSKYSGFFSFLIKASIIRALPLTRTSKFNILHSEKDFEVQQ